MQLARVREARAWRPDMDDLGPMQDRDATRVIGWDGLHAISILRREEMAVLREATAPCFEEGDGVGRVRAGVGSCVSSLPYGPSHRDER